ncbi:MAG TPA: hypothetical protein VGM27_16130, partial [Acidobacteriaceae bacterium]
LSSCTAVTKKMLPAISLGVEGLSPSLLQILEGRFIEVSDQRLSSCRCLERTDGIFPCIYPPEAAANLHRRRTDTDAATHSIVALEGLLRTKAELAVELV